MTIEDKELLHFVAAQTAVLFNVIDKTGRAKLLRGLKLLLPPAEFEQCEILELAISQAEAAKRRADEAQLQFGEMLADKI